MTRGSIALKRFAVLTLLLFVFAFASGCTAYADSLQAQDAFSQKFVITGGIDAEKEAETTFDKSRTISGTAEVGSTVTIKVSCAADGKSLQPDVYSLTVGSSGYFSQSIDLSVGENEISIIAEKDGVSACINSTIKRKKSEIKTELSKKISFPSV